MPADESWMQNCVQKFLRRKIHCDFSSTNFNFQNIQFDVVGYETKGGIFHIVECKRSAKAAEIGHAFGQLLAYKSVLHQTGYEFLNEFFRQAHLKVNLDAILDAVATRNLNAKFYVGLTQKACGNVGLLDVMKQSLPYVGIVRVNPDGKCRDYVTVKGVREYDLCASKIIPVPVRRVFTRARFLQSVEARLRNKFPDGHFSNSKTSTRVNVPYGDYEKFWFSRRSFHYEVTLRKTYVEIALHLEANRELNLSMYSYFKKRSSTIRKTLGKEVKIARWGKKDWRRVYEHMRPVELTEETVEQVSRRLGNYMEVLEPMVEEFEKTHAK
jgi:hypothetical protein